MALEEARVAEQQEAMAKLAADLKREQEVKMAEISEMMRAKEEKLRREIAELQVCIRDSWTAGVYAR